MKHHPAWICVYGYCSRIVPFLNHQCCTTIWTIILTSIRTENPSATGVVSGNRLEVRTHPEVGVYVENLQEIETPTW